MDLHLHTGNHSSLQEYTVQVAFSVLQYIKLVWITNQILYAHYQTQISE